MHDTTFTGEKDGATARKWWGELRQHAREGASSGDEKQAEAGERLLKMTSDAEASTTMYEVRVAPQDAGWKTLFQGAERCENNHCTLTFDPAPTVAPMPIELAHELSGAYRRLNYGAVHTAANGAIVGENWARTIYGCVHVMIHTPTACRP